MKQTSSLRPHMLVLCGFLAGISLTLMAGKGSQHKASRAQVVQKSDANAVHVGKGKAHAWQLVKGQQAYMGVLSLAAGGAVPEHRDQTEEFLYVVEGNGIITIDGINHSIAPGTAVYMPAGAKVKYKNGDQKLVVVQVFAKPGPEAKYKKWTPGVYPPRKVIRGRN